MRPDPWHGRALGSGQRQISEVPPRRDSEATLLAELSTPQLQGHEKPAHWQPQETHHSESSASMSNFMSASCFSRWIIYIFPGSHLLVWMLGWFVFLLREEGGFPRSYQNMPGLWQRPRNKEKDRELLKSLFYWRQTFLSSQKPTHLLNIPTLRETDSSQWDHHTGIFVGFLIMFFIGWACMMAAHLALPSTLAQEGLGAVAPSSCHSLCP